MSSFDEWLKDNPQNVAPCEYVTLEIAYNASMDDMKEAYNAGMERAAEITESFPDASNRGALVLCAEVIRREIEK